ncbi:hypothetical protein, partial [Neglectibacter sp. 59]|uniref:hypothetical protein n=2 Tax=unclassified Neglectibacter TaxID=2632164 RepID=UPI001370C485
MGETGNSTFDEELLAQCAYALGYDLARALAVMGDAFARGLAGGFADMAAPAGGVELVHSEEDEEPELKTEIRDCRACWCDACAKLEDCQQRRDGAKPDGIRPFPCIGCLNGMR